MKNSSKIVDFIIEKKFKEILHANKTGKLYDFKSELKKELESTLSKLNNPNHKKELEVLLSEINKQKFSNSWMN